MNCCPQPVALTRPGNNDDGDGTPWPPPEAHDYYHGTKTYASPFDIESFDVLSFWLQVSEPTIEFTVRMEDTDGTVSFMLFNEVYWGPLFYPGKWYHIEWPFKDLPASVTYYIDSLEVMTKQEWRRSKEEYPMIEPTDYAYANDRFQLGMYVDVVVGAGKLFPDMKNHGVDFIGVYHNRYDNHVFKNASYVRKLGLRVDSEYYPSDEDPHEI